MDLEADLDRLDRALVATGRIVAGITEGQWDLASPCEGWTVRTVTNHLVGGLRIFAGQLTENPVEGDHDGHDWLRPAPSAAYDAAARDDRQAWRRDGAGRTMFDLAFGTVPAPLALVVHLTEVVVHGLDLAVATDQEELVDRAAAASLHRTMLAMGTDAFRVPGIFGPEVAARVDAAPHRRLLAYLGRDLEQDRR